MLKSIAHKTQSGELLVNLAREHLRHHQWGDALIAIEEGLAKGAIDDLEEATELLADIYARLGLRSGYDPR